MQRLTVQGDRLHHAGDTRTRKARMPTRGVLVAYHQILLMSKDLRSDRRQDAQPTLSGLREVGQGRNRVEPDRIEEPLITDAS